MAIYSRRDFEKAFEVSTPRTGFYRRHVKRALDIVFVALIAVPVALVVGLLAVLISLDGASPIYRQERVGLNGRRFQMLKLRSMVPDADHQLMKLLRSSPAARQEWEEKQKLTHDPRITKIGKFIRKTSLDELPQFWNVLRGDMSVVGPRPMMTKQVQLYPGTVYYAMRPGITGFWQISDRNESSFAQRALYDDDYHRALSFSTDVAVIVRTVAVVATATGM